MGLDQSRVSGSKRSEQIILDWIESYYIRVCKYECIGSEKK